MALFPMNSVSGNAISLNSYRNTSVTNAVSDGKAAKIENIVIVTFFAHYNSATTGTTPCFTLPTGYRPSQSVYGSCTIMDENGVVRVGQPFVNSNGDIGYNSTDKILRMTGTLVYDV